MQPECSFFQQTISCYLSKVWESNQDPSPVLMSCIFFFLLNRLYKTIYINSIRQMKCDECLLPDALLSKNLPIRTYFEKIPTDIQQFPVMPSFKDACLREENDKISFDIFWSFRQNFTTTLLPCFNWFASIDLLRLIGFLLQCYY